jgi:diaminopimelate decarboxylase
VIKLHDRLVQAAARFGTPAYVYDADEIARRFEILQRLFGEHFGVSYAVKANPNVRLMQSMLPHLATFDVSSFKEFERALEAGCPARQVTFSGPAKRPGEIHGAVALGLGELVIESLAEAKIADQAAAELGVIQSVLLRINPANAPRRFGVSFSGRASQFGVDEEDLDEAIDHLMATRHLQLVGFHIFSGTNSVDAEAIAENFAIFVRLFQRAAARADIAPRKLIFGSGFGISYGGNEAPLDIERVAAGVLPMIVEMKRDPRFAQAQCILEMGRWLVGPAGWLLTSVVGEKHSRGTDYRLCDAGFNNHLAACGMMGAVIRRNWSMLNVSNPAGTERTYTLVGPLCTSIDILATAVPLPELRIGDVVAIENSGAYGLTASPTRFISHPEPAEVLLMGGEVVDITESAANTWALVDRAGDLRKPGEAASLGRRGR